MPFAGYLAMTAAEMQKTHPLPEKVAYMACHFSPYTLGLSNLPSSLPPGSLLMLNDRTPICGHDPDAVMGQLEDAVKYFSCTGVVLDFQRPGAEAMVHAASALPCPVCVTPSYGEIGDFPVLVPPVPPDRALADWLKQFPGKEQWLELAVSVMTVTVAAGGAAAAFLPPWDAPKNGHADKELFCHYEIRLKEDAAVFTLFRTDSDIAALAEKAAGLGISQFIGLYQEFL